MTRAFRCTALFLTVSLAAAAQPPAADKPAKKPNFTLSKETTYVLGPVDSDGWIDYVAAADELCRRGVTADNNAMVPLLRAIGPKPEGVPLQARHFDRLGIPTPPEKGAYFVPLEKGAGIDAEGAAALRDRLVKRPWSAAEFPAAAAWVKANEPAAKLAAEAGRRSHCYWPSLTSDPKKYQGLMAILLPTLQPTRGLATLLLARAMLRTQDGKLDEAMEDLLACRRLGRVVAKGGTLIDVLVGIVVDSAAGEADLAWLAADGQNAARLTAFRTALDRLPPMPPLVDKIERTERLAYLDNVLLTARHGARHLEALSGGTVDAGNARRIMQDLLFADLPLDVALTDGNAWYDRIAAVMKKEDRAARTKGLAQLDEELKLLREELMGDPVGLAAAKAGKPEVRARLLGQLLRCLLTPAFIKVQQAADKNEQGLRNVKVAVALAAFRLEKGSYPAKLSELAPKFMAAVPTDLFSVGELKYARTANGYLLYSVGVNEKDDGGKTREEDPQCDDLAVRMPLPAGKALAAP